ncbi:MAG: DUF1015 family protein [Nocardioides sp.]
MESSVVVSPPHVAGPFRMHPFRGLMLVPRRVGDPASARAFARPYREVAGRLRQWESRGHVHRDPTPALYVHEYTGGGITIRGIVGALDLSRRATRADQAVVYPHEGIHPAQSAELADRMSEMGMNPAPILLVHRGPSAARRLIHDVIAAPPDHEFTDRAEHRNRIWAIRDTQRLEDLATAVGPSRALIADGHHRYAAYLRMQESHPGTPADRGLAMVVDQDDTPLFLGAIHRVLSGTRLDDLRQAADRMAEVRTAISREAAVDALAPHTMVATDGEVWTTLRLRSTSRAAVEQLHQDLIPALGRAPGRIGHHHSVDDVLSHLPARGVAVLMPAIDYDVVRRVVADERLLPEKATSFQPKPSLGVLMRSLRDE